MLNLSLTITTSLSSLPLLMAKLRELDEELGGHQKPPPSTVVTPAATGAPPVARAVLDEQPASLTDGQGRLLVEGCSPKTLTVLRKILDGRNIPFRFSTLAQDLGGNDVFDWVWGGLTRRTRNILADPNARLIVWRNHPYVDGKWVDADGIMAEATVAALRRALGITPAAT